MQKTFTADLTKFQLPNGQKRLVRIVLPVTLEDKYNALIRCGCRLTSEELRTGHLSVAIEEPNLGDFVCKILPKGSKIEEALANAILAFDEEIFAEWKAHQEG